MNSAADLHTYCYHACGYDIFNVPSITLDFCTPGGHCQCNYPCGTPPPTNLFGDVCPPHSPPDPPDPDPFSIPRCNAACSDLCPGGRGMVCGEVYFAPIPPTTNTWAKICTCYCPSLPCVFPSTTTTTTTTTTSTTTPTPPTPAPRVVVVKKPIKLPKLPFLIFFKVIKWAKVFYVLIKVCLLYWTNLTMMRPMEIRDEIGWGGWSGKEGWWS